MPLKYKVQREHLHLKSSCPEVLMRKVAFRNKTTFETYDYDTTKYDTILRLNQTF